MMMTTTAMATFRMPEVVLQDRSRRPRRPRANAENATSVLKTTISYQKTSLMCQLASMIRLYALPAIHNSSEPVSKPSLLTVG